MQPFGAVVVLLQNFGAYVAGTLFGAFVGIVEPYAQTTLIGSGVGIARDAVVVGVVVGVFLLGFEQRVGDLVPVDI